jgi:hypothetical protein
VDKPADLHHILLFVHEDIDVALADVFPLFRGQLRATLGSFRRLSVRHVRLPMNFVLIPSCGSLPARPDLLAFAKRQSLLTRLL